MFKVKRIIHSGVNENQAMEGVYDRYLSKAKKLLFKLIFALATSAKITPKQLANAFMGDKVDKFAEKFSIELRKKEEEVSAKLEKSINKK